VLAARSRQTLTAGCGDFGSQSTGLPAVLIETERRGAVPQRWPEIGSQRHVAWPRGMCVPISATSIHRHLAAGVTWWKIVDSLGQILRNKMSWCRGGEIGHTGLLVAQAQDVGDLQGRKLAAYAGLAPWAT